MPAAARVEAALGQAPRALRPLSGGCVGDVFRAEMADGDLVVKLGQAGSQLDLEGWMLEVLAGADLPVPEVVHAADDILIMTYIEGGGALDARAEAHAAELIAALHENTADSFGLERDTLIGGLHQPNPPAEKWIPFFRDQRLLYMGCQALDAGRLPGSVFARLETLAERVGGGVGRPLLQTGDPAEVLRELSVRRGPDYEAVADHVVDTDGRSVEEVADSVMAVLPDPVAT